METKAPKQKRNGGAFPPCNTTNFSWHFTSVVNHCDCRPKCTDVSLFGQHACLHCRDQIEKAKLRFLHKSIQHIFGFSFFFFSDLGNTLQQQWRLRFDLNPSPALQGINNTKLLNRDSSKVRTQTRSISGGHCQFRRLWSRKAAATSEVRSWAPDFSLTLFVSHWWSFSPVEKKLISEQKL